MAGQGQYAEFTHVCGSAKQWDSSANGGVRPSISKRQTTVALAIVAMNTTVIRAMPKGYVVTAAS